MTLPSRTSRIRLWRFGFELSGSGSGCGCCLAILYCIVLYLIKRDQAKGCFGCPECGFERLGLRHDPLGLGLQELRALSEESGSQTSEMHSIFIFILF